MRLMKRPKVDGFWKPSTVNSINGMKHRKYKILICLVTMPCLFTRDAHEHLAMVRRVVNVPTMLNIKYTHGSVSGEKYCQSLPMSRI